MVVDAMKYPPVGHRGAAFGFASRRFRAGADVGDNARRWTSAHC